MLYPLTKYAKKCSGGWIDRCPAHDDKNPSLSIKETSAKTSTVCWELAKLIEILLA